MDFNQFLKDRQPRWQQLSQLLDQVDKGGLGSLGPAEADRLFALYRLVSADLNLVQTRTGNPSLLEYLEKLVGRAYACLAVPRRAYFFQSWWRIMRHEFPHSVRLEIVPLAVAALTMAVGTVFGFCATLLAPYLAELFLPPEHLWISPAERVAELESLERSGQTRISSASQHTLFSTFLATHNIRVTVLCFALGITMGVGTILLLFINGAMLGSLAALYLADGVFVFFLAWIGPHGAIELPCVLFGGAAGLMIARAQLRYNSGSFRAQLREIRPVLIRILIGTSTLLVLAAAVEGGFSQVNEPTLPYPLKIAVALGLFLALLVYLFVIPVRPRGADEDIGLEKS